MAAFTLTAVPKSKISKRRGANRRHGQRQRAAPLSRVHVLCPECGCEKLNHHVCAHCAKYGAETASAPPAAVQG